MRGSSIRSNINSKAIPFKLHASVWGAVRYSGWRIAALLSVIDQLSPWIIAALFDQSNALIFDVKELMQPLDFGKCSV